tara:strand:+ start:224 stop:736 length:513 start_codon:yes stop_codon:yes gene_type:complete
MENEDYRIITLHDNKLKVYRDGRIEREHIYKHNARSKLYKKGDIKWKPQNQYMNTRSYYSIVLSYNSITKSFRTNRVMGYTFLGLDIDNLTQVIDHIDNNPANNNLINLRLTSLSGNQHNRKNTKGYSKRNNKWISRIYANGKKIHLGYYKTEACARFAYLTAKSHYHQF